MKVVDRGRRLGSIQLVVFPSFAILPLMADSDDSYVRTSADVPLHGLDSSFESRLR